MKLCIDCKHFKPTYGFCISPKNGESPVDGEPKSRLATIQRSDYTLLFTDLCGPDAVNFEEKPLGAAPALSFMRKLIQFSRSRK